MGNLLQRHFSPNCVVVIVGGGGGRSIYTSIYLSICCLLDRHRCRTATDGNRAICYIRASDDDDSTNTFFAVASLRLIDILKAFVAAA